ncbi:MAG: hypothetical protein IH904_03050 [Proteobacteria bacterium]|nr:hypothetical protein [Pseudomonadota bacterium]
MGRIEKTERDNATNAAKQADKAKTVAVGDLVVRVATGKAFPAEIDLALAEGTIGAAEHADFLAEIERFDDDRAKGIEGMVRVNDLLARGEKPDAEDAADRAAVDALFEGLAEIPDYTLTRAQAINAFAYPGLAPARTVQLADNPSCSQTLRESNGLNRRNRKLGAGQDRRRHHHIVVR